MKNKQVIKIITWSTIVLAVPIFGQLFVNGWNWGPGDFVFAWIFFNLLGFTYTFVTNKINHRVGRVVAGIFVIAIFAFVWVMLATG